MAHQNSHTSVGLTQGFFFFIGPLKGADSWFLAAHSALSVTVEFSACGAVQLEHV